ncbi:Family of unknown function [Nonomuraea maritima]|uniref:DUF695 domain-containing protein n=2 Tax=Nonomuraea maritima TaxID=683260 RepID=A0A1G8VJB3_9ACTN|nr:Family of unknown function [Nonomuraea maritima]
MARVWKYASMRLFGRKNADQEARRAGEAVAGFWAWWHETRARLDGLMAAGDDKGLQEVLGPAVAAIHPDLVWDVVPGGEAAHALVVTAAGDAELRPLAHRWAAAAPPSDLLWEFHPSRRASPRALELTLPVDGYDIALGAFKLGLRMPPNQPRVDVTAYHPLFGELEADTRMDATLLALDHLLGEDDVARWVGEITPATFEPIDAVAAAHLPAVVADVASGYADDDWVRLEGRTGSGAALAAVARHPLRPVDRPLLDQHVAVTLPYRHRDGDGLPADASLAALRDVEERVTALLDARPDAALTVQLSAEGQSVLHVYADSTGDAADRVKELVAGWPEGRARVDVTADPAWTAIAPFLT